MASEPLALVLSEQALKPAASSNKPSDRTVSAGWIKVDTGGREPLKQLLLVLGNTEIEVTG